MTNFYKKQVEIAREFGVSEGTVSNWINAAEEGKNNLQLIELEGKQKIIKSEHNRVEMLNLADNGKKFRPDEDTVELEVSDELYKVIDENLMMSFINDLTLRNEIPYKYSFIGEGGNLWSKLYSSLSTQHKNYGYDELQFLWKNTLEYLSIEMQEYDKINLIDIGPGDFSPSHFWINHICSQGKFGYYIPIDLSKSILEISVSNFLQYFDKKHLKNFRDDTKDSYYSRHVADLDRDSLSKIVNSYRDFSGKKVLNLFIFLGGTIGNMINVERTLQNIKDAMAPDDYLVVDNFFDNVKNRTVFPIAESTIYDNCVKHIPKLLGLTENDFDREYIYDEKSGFREYNLVLRKNFTINFRKLNLSVLLKKNSKLKIWKHRRAQFTSIINDATTAGLSIELIIKHPINPLIIYVSKPKF